MQENLQAQHALYKQHRPSSTADFLQEIAERVYTMPFPEKGVLPRYSKILGEAFEESYKIWNVSEYSFDTAPFNEQVLEYVNTGYPNPFLVQLYMICQEVKSWLASSPENIAIVLCQKTQVRTALVIGCYLFETGEFPHPKAALTHIYEVPYSLTQKFEASEESFLNSCNAVYANYYSHLSSNLSVRF